MKIDTRAFELTPEQIEIVRPDLDLAYMANVDLTPGVIVAQICAFETLSGKKTVHCEFQFIEHERALKIIEIVNEKK